MVLAVFVGFSRSYYLKEIYGTPTLPTLFHVHGLLFTSWMALLVVQTGLVATRRTPVHRRLGVAGGVLAFAMTVAAMAMTVDLARRSAGAPNDIGLAFTIVPFFTVIVFPVLVGIALLYRRQPEIHKRLILIATLELVTAGVARILAPAACRCSSSSRTSAWLPSCSMTSSRAGGRTRLPSGVDCS